jgi:hypothetical protein
MAIPVLPPFEPKTTGSDKFDPDKRKTEIKQLYDASYKFINENYWEELVEAYRAVRVRTEPLMTTNAKGNSVEDTNRTNVCMPGLNTIVKRKTARKTANPPTLNYYVPGDDKDLLAERLTARAYYEYDRSGEAFEFKRFVNQADILGFSYAKSYYDEVTVQRQMRYRTSLLKDRRSFLQAQGAGEDQIKSEVAAKGDTVGETELSDFIQQNGAEIRGTQPFTQYEGPVTKCRFIGDIFIEPGVLTLDASSYVIEKYTETDLWLRKMAAKTYADPETGQQIPVFEREKVQELWDQESKTILDRTQDLRKEFRAAIQKADPQVEQRILPGKRFDITEYHGPDKKGQMWIEYVGNDSVYLGRQPYPFDLCGKFVYTEYVPWPDLIGAFGDSSPRALRFLHAMHNANSGQIIDLVNQVLCRTYKVSSVADIPDQAVKKEFGLFLVMKNGDLNSVVPFTEPGVAPDAWQTNAFIKTEMRENEPSLGGVDSGTEFNPQAEKTATTAILAAKSSDVLMQSEIDALNLALYELGTKKLEIHRQISDTINVPNRKQYIKTEGLSQRYGKTALITIESVPELQDPGIEVEPVAGSTLAVDDELRANKITNIYQMAVQNPSLWNQYKAAKLVLTTVKGVGATDELLNDPGAEAPAGPKVGVNISVPFDKLPPDKQQQVFTAVLGGPSADLEMTSKMEGVKQLSEAADAVANLHSSARRPDPLAEQTQKVSKQVNGAPG